MAKTESLPGLGRTKDKQIEAAAEEYRQKRVEAHHARQKKLLRKVA